MPKMFDGKIKQRTYIDASPEIVYKTITSAKEWDQFFTTGMELELKPGGKCIFSWVDWGPDFYTFKAPGKTVEFVPNKLFSFKWGQEGKETTIRFELEPMGRGTLLTVTEDGYPDTPEGRKQILDCASGWGEAATLLKFYIDQGVTYKRPKKKS